jgi:type IV pilus assembly protein PilA
MAMVGFAVGIISSRVCLPRMRGAGVRLRPGVGARAADPPRPPRCGEDAGFTLIELLVVVLIMGILIAIAVPTFLSLTGTSKDTAAEANLASGLQTEMDALATQGTWILGVTGRLPIPALTALEPAFMWTGVQGQSSSSGALDNYTGSNQIPNELFVNSWYGYLELGTQSSAGRCFYLENGAMNSPSTGTGYQLGSGPTCAHFPVPAVPIAGRATANPDSTTIWYTAW